MFKKRAIKVTVEKADKKQPEDTVKDDRFEGKADYVLHKLERIGVKVFLGVCVYIVLDTCRQVAVANAIYNPEE